MLTKIMSGFLNQVNKSYFLSENMTASLRYDIQVIWVSNDPLVVGKTFYILSEKIEVLKGINEGRDKAFEYLPTSEEAKEFRTELQNIFLDVTV